MLRTVLLIALFTIAGFAQAQYNAAFVAQSVPTMMQTGQSYPVSVTMRNSSSATWTAADLYRLGSQSPQDNTTWGFGRVAVPQTTGPYGSEATFAFNVTAPTTPGTYNFRWRMVRDGVAWFGEYTPMVAVDVTTTPPSGGGLQNNTRERTSAFEYDSAGLLVKEIIEPDSPALCLVTIYGNDSYGNRNTSQTRNCDGTAGNNPPNNSETIAPTGDAVFTPRTSSTSFAATPANPVAGQFPTTSINALGQSETKEFDARFGVVTKLTGPNTLDTIWTYDGFGRKKLETRADGTKTKWEYILCPASDCTHANAKMVVKTTPLAADGTTPTGPISRVNLDMLNREVRGETQGFDGVYVRKDTQYEYDSDGRVERISKPYLDGATAVHTVYRYDLLGRVKRVDEPATESGAARTVTTYNGLVTTVTVSNAGAGTNLPGGVTQSRTTTKNSQGQVIQVTQQ